MQQRKPNAQKATDGVFHRAPKIRAFEERGGWAHAEAPRKHMRGSRVSAPIYIRWHVVGGWCACVCVGPRARRLIFSTSFYTRTKCDPYDATQKIQNYECHRPPRANTEVGGSNHLHRKRSRKQSPHSSYLPSAYLGGSFMLGSNKNGFSFFLVSHHCGCLQAAWSLCSYQNDIFLEVGYPCKKL